MSHINDLHLKSVEFENNVHPDDTAHSEASGPVPFTQEVEGSSPTGGTCPNDFFRSNRPEYPHQCARSWKIVVSEWRSVIAVSLNVGGGVRLIKPTKLYICTQAHYQNDEDGRTAPGLRGYGSVPLSHSGNVVTRIGLHTHNTAHNGPPELDLHCLPSIIWTLCII